MTPGPRLLPAVLLLLATTAPASAQTAVSALFGENADAATGASSGPAISLVVSRAFDFGGARVAGGLPTDASRGSRWAGAGAWADVALLPRLGILAGADAFAYHDPVLDATGGAATATLQLYAPIDAGPAVVRIRGGGRAGVLGGDPAGVRRGLGEAGVDVTVVGRPGIIRGAAEVWLAEEGAYPRLSVVAVATVGPATITGSLIDWLHDDVPGTGWSATAEVPIVGRLALVAAAASPATDILFSSPAQRSWSAGLRWGIAPPPAAVPVPVVVGAGEPVRVAVDATPGGEAVRIAGTFNDWTPAPMVRAGGRWVTELRLPPGFYEYAFVAADGSWFVPEGTPGRKADGFGGFIATLVVR